MTDCELGLLTIFFNCFTLVAVSYSFWRDRKEEKRPKPCPVPWPYCSPDGCPRCRGTGALPEEEEK